MKTPLHGNIINIAFTLFLKYSTKNGKRQEGNCLAGKRKKLRNCPYDDILIMV